MGYRMQQDSVGNGARGELQRMKDRLKPVTFVQKDEEKVVNEFDNIHLRKPVEIKWLTESVNMMIFQGLEK